MFIDNNSIGDEGAIALAGVIATHKSLTDLRICNTLIITQTVDNFFGDEGAEALVVCAAKSEKMKDLGICKKELISIKVVGNIYITEDVRRRLIEMKGKLNLYEYFMNTIL